MTREDNRDKKDALSPPPAAKRNSGQDAGLPLVVAAVITYNGSQWIRKCLTSLESTAYKPLKIIVIDNASRDGTAEIARSAFPFIGTVKLAKNVGYGAACNQAIERAYNAGAEHVVLLNQDISVPPDWLDPLVSAAEAIPSLGILSPIQVGYEDGRVDPFVERVMTSMRMDDVSIPPDRADEVLPVRNVIGAAMLLPLRTIERVGGFDPIYFMYGEETDLCERLLYHGLFPAIVKSSVVRHFSTRAEKEPTRRVYGYYLRNQYINFLKNPNAGFARNLYSYARSGFWTITARLISEDRRARSSFSSKLGLMCKILYANIRVAAILPTLRETHRLERRGPCHVRLDPAARATKSRVLSRSESEQGMRLPEEPSKHLRVLLGVPHDPFTSIGGAEIHARNLARYLRDRGCAVRVVCVERDELFARDGRHTTADVDGITIDRIQFPERYRKLADRLALLYKSDFVGRTMRAIADQFRPDICHLISGYLLTGSAATAAYRLGIPTVLSLVDYWFFCPRLHRVRSNGSLCERSDYGGVCSRCLLEERRRFRLMARYAPPVARIFWKNADTLPLFGAGFRRLARTCRRRHQFLNNILRQARAVMSPSQHVLAMASSEGVPNEKLHRIPHGIAVGDPEQPQRQDEKTALRLGYFGTITHLKGVHVAVSAMQRFTAADSVELLIYGAMDRSSAYARRLRERARRTPRVRLMGEIPHDRVQETMASLDAVVIPTLCFETFSFAAHEAFATRTPVLCSRNAATETIVSDGVNGLLFERGNPDDLCAKIRQLIEQPGLLERLRVGIEPVSSLEEEMERIEQIYLSLLEQTSDIAHSVQNPVHESVKPRD